MPKKNKKKYIPGIWFAELCPAALLLLSVAEWHPQPIPFEQSEMSKYVKKNAKNHQKVAKKCTYLNMSTVWECLKHTKLMKSIIWLYKCADGTEFQVI